MIYFWSTWTIQYHSILEPTSTFYHQWDLEPPWPVLLVSSHLSLARIATQVRSLARNLLKDLEQCLSKPDSLILPHAFREPAENPLEGMDPYTVEVPLCLRTQPEHLSQRSLWLMHWSSTMRPLRICSRRLMLLILLLNHLYLLSASSQTSMNLYHNLLQFLHLKSTLKSTNINLWSLVLPIMLLNHSCLWITLNQASMKLSHTFPQFLHQTSTMNPTNICKSNLVLLLFLHSFPRLSVASN